MVPASVLLLVTLIVSLTTALPVIKSGKVGENEQQSSTPATADVQTALEYERYLKEVVEALESDPEFRKKLDKSPEADIRSGKIALELEFVSHQIRSNLDEIKRREIQRIRTLTGELSKLRNDIDSEHIKVPQHLDHSNQNTFEIEDLRKLIQQTSSDLQEADRKRRVEFKEYEMQKEFERESQMKEMDEANRQRFEQEIKKQQQTHKKHEKVHHPGNKAQLEEVWEKQDHMNKQDFDPQAFFMIHDVDGNGFWDETEVKALFVKELDKVYQSGLPEDDMRERAEEMELMREHVFKEIDNNQDGLVSFQEFLDQTNRAEFNKDPDWETVDEQPQYTHDEYLEFERRRQEEIQRLVAEGMLPAHPNMPQGYYRNDVNSVHQTAQPGLVYGQPGPDHQVQLDRKQVYQHISSKDLPEKANYQQQPTDQKPSPNFQQQHPPNSPQQQSNYQQERQQNYQQQQPNYPKHQAVQHQPLTDNIGQKAGHAPIKT